MNIRFTDVCFLTDDVPRLRAFYEDVFAVNAEGDEYHSGLDLGNVIITIDSAKLLRESDPFRYVSSQSSDNTIIGFDVEDVDKEYVRLSALGAVMVNEPTTHPWGARSLQFRDPDGNILNFRTVK